MIAVKSKVFFQTGKKTEPKLVLGCYASAKLTLKLDNPELCSKTFDLS